MFIWDFVASTVMDDLIDWFYGQLVGFLGNFFAQMGNMGVELFDLEWVQAVILFFSKLAWALFAVSLVVRAFECAQSFCTICRSEWQTPQYNTSMATSFSRRSRRSKE